MKYDPAVPPMHRKNGTRLELLPLNSDQLDLCLELLRAKLHKKTAVRRLVNLLENTDLEENGKIHIRQTLTGKEMALWRVGLHESLARAQDKCRARATGPRYADTDPCRGYPSFDIWAVTGNEHVLPRFMLGYRTAGPKDRERIIPFLELSVGSAEDVFDWLLLRAIANQQLSRFAHCVVCGSWTLKKISGRGSAKLAYTEPKKPNLDMKIWRSFRRRLPMWPALCDDKECKTLFHNVRRGRTKFKVEDFSGLRDKGIAQLKWSGKFSGVPKSILERL
jgi:hypothetical protein